MALACGVMDDTLPPMSNSFIGHDPADSLMIDEPMLDLGDTGWAPATSIHSVMANEWQLPR